MWGTEFLKGLYNAWERDKEYKSAIDIKFTSKNENHSTHGNYMLYKLVFCLFRPGVCEHGSGKLQAHDKKVMWYQNHVTGRGATTAIS